MEISKIIEDHYNKIYVSECSDCKTPLTEYQWNITMQDIPGVCPTCVDKAVKKSMGIIDEEDDSSWDDIRYFRRF